MTTAHGSGERRIVRVFAKRLTRPPVVGAILACAVTIWAVYSDEPVMGDPDAIASALEAADVSDWGAARDGELVAVPVTVRGDRRFCLPNDRTSCVRGAGGVVEKLRYDHSHAKVRPSCRRSAVCETIFTLTAASRWNVFSVDTAFADDFDLVAEVDLQDATIWEYSHHVDMTYEAAAASPEAWRERGGLINRAEVLRVLPAGVHTLIGVRRGDALAPIDAGRLENAHRMVLGAPGKQSIGNIAARVRMAWEPRQPRWMFPGLPTASLFMAGIAAFFMSVAAPILILGDRWGCEASARAQAIQPSAPWKDRLENLSPWATPLYFVAFVAVLRLLAAS